MNARLSGARVIFQNILFLTDFSEPSELALQFAGTIAREFGAEIHALHVLLPQPLLYTSAEAINAIAAVEEAANIELKRVDSQLSGVSHETISMRSPDVWSAVDQAIATCCADLIVLGTHGRTGLQKLVLGSVAEEIFRKSPLPVLTIGPSVRKGVHGAGHFRRVLYATDFGAEAKAAAPYALSLAQENQAQLVLLHVIPSVEKGRDHLSVAEAMHGLLECAPAERDRWCRPEPLVQYGQPAERILGEAVGRGVDLIVLGARGTEGRVRAAIHLQHSVAYRVVANAPCPVLTVRANEPTA